MHLVQLPLRSFAEFKGSFLLHERFRCHVDL
jgi:hypothetical protein